MAETYFTNFTPHDLVIFCTDDTQVTIPKSGKVLSVSSTCAPRQFEVCYGVPVFDVPTKDILIGVSQKELDAAGNIIVSTMTAEYLAQEPDTNKVACSVYAPSTRREDQVRDDKGAIVGIRALQRYV